MMRHAPQGSEALPETVEEAREQIVQTRAQLGETVRALAKKVDVKAQVRRKADVTRARLSEKTKSLKTSLAEGPTGAGSPTASLRRVTEEVADRLVTATRANPLRVLVMVLLVGWLLGRRSRRRIS